MWIPLLFLIYYYDYFCKRKNSAKALDFYHSHQVPSSVNWNWCVSRRASIRKMHPECAITACLDLTKCLYWWCKATISTLIGQILYRNCIPYSCNPTNLLQINIDCSIFVAIISCNYRVYAFGMNKNNTFDLTRLLRCQQQLIYHVSVYNCKQFSTPHQS